MATASYDPGRPTPCRKIGTDTFAVDSFTGSHRAYVVTLDGENSTCDCPHFQQRLKGTGEVCKHVRACRDQAAWLEAHERAEKLTDEQLDQWLRFHQERGNLIVAGAIRAERYRRKAEAEADAALRRLFA